MEDFNKVYVPPIKIQGIKTKLVPILKELADSCDYDVWVEPFMGSGVVGFNIRPEKAIFADINPHLIRFYNAIKSGELSHVYIREQLTLQGALLEQWDGDYYNEVRSRFNAEHSPMDFLFLNRSCFNGVIRFNQKGRFNTPYGHKPQRFSKAYITKIVNQVLYVENSLKMYDWEFKHASFEQTISSAPAGSLIYCDPPYIARHVDYYGGWTEDNEVKLHSCLNTSEHRYIVSTWKGNQFRQNPYIQSVWGDCAVFERKHFYHVGGKQENRNEMVEAILTNDKRMLLPSTMPSVHTQPYLPFMELSCAEN